MKKKWIMAVIILSFVLSACGSSGQSSKEEQPADNGKTEETESSEAVSGGWELVQHDEASLPEEVQLAWDKAAESYTGDELKPVVYIASQVVAGVNYMILCETTDPVAYKMATVYKDLDGNAEISAVNDFDLTAYTEGENTEINSGELAGGWDVPEDTKGLPIPDEAQAAFEKAAAELDGNVIEPLALLGTQLVSGTNYALLCKSMLVTEQPVTGIQVVTVYEDLDGNAEIINISTLEQADFNK